MALLAKRSFSARFGGEVADAVCLEVAGWVSGEDGRGGEEDDAAQLVALVAGANFRGDGEVGLVGEDVGFDCRWVAVRACGCWWARGVV